MDLGISAHLFLSCPCHVSCELTLDSSLIVLLHVTSASLTLVDPSPLELCLAHVCPTGRSFEHLGMIMVHVSCLDDP